MSEEQKSVFNTLNDINVSEKTEQKGNLTYLSWPFAWAEVKKRHPDAQYTVYENKDGWNYFTDGKTCWVKTGVTINGIEHIEYLPVMDARNNSIPLERITSFEVNKTIQRSITKAIARHGLGLYIYAGEDLPESEAKDKPKQAQAPVTKPIQPQEQPKQVSPDNRATEAQVRTIQYLLKIKGKTLKEDPSTFSKDKAEKTIELLRNYPDKPQ